LSLYPGEAHKLLYCLQLRKDDFWAKQGQTVFGLGNLGHLHSDWNNVANGFGGADSKFLTMPIIETELNIALKEPITKLKKEIIVAAEIIITNKYSCFLLLLRKRADIPLELLFNISEKEMQGIKIIGLSSNVIP